MQNTSQTANGASGAADRIGNTGNGRDAVNQAQTEAGAATQQASQSMQGAQDRAREAVTPENVEKTANTGAKTSWGLLISMVLGLGASMAGGVIGGKSRATTATA